MRNHLKSFFMTLVNYRLAIGVVTTLTVIFALATLFRMPLQLLPEVYYPQIRVIGDLPGQTSEVIEESVNEPLEVALAGTPALRRMESRSGDGRSYIDLFFEPGRDMNRALSDVSQGVQLARSAMPPGFPEPRIFEVATSGEPAMQFAFGSSRHSAAEIRQLLRTNLLPRLRAIDGVDMVFIGREENPELVVDIDPWKQQSYGISLDTIETSLRQATSAPRAGQISTSDFEGAAVLDRAVWDAEALLQRSLAPEGASDASVPLRNLAQAYRAPYEIQLHTRLNGDPAVLVTIHRSSRAQSLRMAEQARATVDRLLERSIFENIEGTLLFDDSVVTSGAVQSVMVAATIGSLLAMGLVFIALKQGRKVVLVGYVILVSLASAILALAGSGMTLNLLTLAGLLISVGLGLDYAIIYFDRMERLGSSVEGREAQAMVDVAAPLLGALLTTVAAIAPFLWVEGLVAQVFRPLILTVIFSSIFSYLAALIILPAYAGWGGNTETITREVGHWNSRAWRATQSRWFAWPVSLALLAGLVVIGQHLPFEVLPSVDDGFVDVRLTHPAGIPTSAMDEITRAAERALAGVAGTEGLFTTVGGYFREGLPAFRPGTANFMVRVNTEGGRRPSPMWVEDATGALKDIDVPQLRHRFVLPRIRGVRTRLSDSDIEVVLTRPDGDLIALGEAALAVENELRKIEGLTGIDRMRAGVSPRWRIEPDYAALSRYGIRLSELERVVAYTIEGVRLDERMESGDPLSLRVRFDRSHAGSPHHLQLARIPAQDGTWVHLADLASYELVEEPTHIERRENQRVVRIGAQLDPAGPGPARVAREVESVLTDMVLPSDVSWWIEGEIEALKETRQTFTLALAMALLIILMILIVQYGSLRWAFAGWMVIPLCGFGSMLLLWLMGQALDAMVLAGLLISIGIVANSVILVISEAAWRREKYRDEDLSSALAFASRARLRPVVLTVLSTTLGMSPLLFGGSEVFGLLQPLAIALTGSLLISVPIACILLPSIIKSLGDKS